MKADFVMNAKYGTVPRMFDSVCEPPHPIRLPATVARRVDTARIRSVPVVV
jgi:hypothetical protein